MPPPNSNYVRFAELVSGHLSMGGLEHKCTQIILMGLDVGILKYG